MKLSTLKRIAQSATTFRGHRMQWEAPSGHADRMQQLAVCRLCGADVQLLTYPLPNQIDIGGPAVAITCTHSKGEK